MCARPTRTDGTAIILLFLPDFRKPARRIAARPTVGGRARGVWWPRLIRSHHRRTPANGVEVRNGRFGGNGRLLLITAAAVRRRVAGGV